MPYPPDFSNFDAGHPNHPHHEDAKLEPADADALEKVEDAECLLRQAADKMKYIECYTWLKVAEVREAIEDVLCDYTGPLAESIRERAR